MRFLPLAIAMAAVLATGSVLSATGKEILILIKKVEADKNRLTLENCKYNWTFVTVSRKRGTGDWEDITAHVAMDPTGQAQKKKGTATLGAAAGDTEANDQYEIKICISSSTSEVDFRKEQKAASWSVHSPGDDWDPFTLSATSTFDSQEISAFTDAEVTVGRLESNEAIGYTWTQVEGSTVSLNTDDGEVEFTAPSTAGTIVLECEMELPDHSEYFYYIVNVLEGV